MQIATEKTESVKEEAKEDDTQASVHRSRKRTPLGLIELTREVRLKTAFAKHIYDAGDLGSDETQKYHH